MKLKKIILSLMAITVLSLSLTGCFLFNANNSITMVQAPLAEYEQGSAQTLSFSVKVLYDSKEYLLTYPDENLEVTGFSTANTGSFEATIKYIPAGDKLVIKFGYKVVSAQASGLNGSGTAADPYKLASARDFYTMVTDATYTGNEYYEMTSDIDFSVLSTEQMQTYADKLVERAFNFTGTLDGKDFTILNLTVAESKTQNATGLFYEIAPAQGTTVIFKNINFSNCTIASNSAAGAGLLGMGKGYGAADQEALKTTHGSVVVENVNMDQCTVRGQKNASLYIGLPAGLNITFKNCTVTNTCSVMTSGYGAGTFVGSGATMAYISNNAAPSKTLLSFDNCVSSAKITASSIAHGFLGNYTQHSCYTTERKNGSKFTGSIYHSYVETSDVNANYNSGAKTIMPDVENTAADNYTIYYKEAAATGTGYKAVNAIKDISGFDASGAFAAGNKGNVLSIAAVEGASKYVFSYYFYRTGTGAGSYTSAFGNSEIVDASRAVNGKISTSTLRFYQKVYDDANENYTAEETVDGNLCMKGAIKIVNMSNSENQKSIVYTVMALDANGNVIASATCTPVADYVARNY